MKIVKQWMAVLMGIVLMVGASVPVLAAGKVKLTVSGNMTPTYQYSQEKELKLTLKNGTAKAIEHVVVSPNMQANTEDWPFEIEQVSYDQTFDKIDAGKSVDLVYKWKAREDVASKYYQVKFDVSYDGLEQPSEAAIFVKMTAKPEPKPEPAPEPVPEPKPEIFQESPVVPGGNSEQAATSVPRVIVTGFQTEPAEVKAGMNFKLIVHLKNTSKETAVKNMLFDFQAPTEGADEHTSSPAFLPVSGASTVYLDKIAANGTKDVAIDLNAKSDLVQKPYSIEMAMKYEDKDGAQFEGASSISVPIKQDARFEFSEFEMSQETVEVGQEVNVMCNLYNMGRTKLYNVKARFEGEGLKSKEQFVGNVDPGATATIDGMITGETETTGDGKAKMIVTYEDEAGTVFTVEKELTMIVTAPILDEDTFQEGMEETTKKGFPIVPVLILFLVVVMIVAVVVVKRSKQKKNKEQEEEMLENELDRFTEDEL